MQCPFCKTDEDRVVDSRVIGSGNAIRRRRECFACGKRFTTYERIEVAPRSVIKKDFRREAFSREKILSGLVRACEKRDIPHPRLIDIVDQIESEVYERFESEVESRVIGELVSSHLRTLDEVAFIRFASVYREYSAAEQFRSEVNALESTVVGGTVGGGAREGVLARRDGLGAESASRAERVSRGGLGERALGPAEGIARREIGGRPPRS